LRFSRKNWKQVLDVSDASSALLVSQL